MAKPKKQADAKKTVALLTDHPVFGTQYKAGSVLLLDVSVADQLKALSLADDHADAVDYLKSQGAEVIELGDQITAEISEEQAEG